MSGRPGSGMSVRCDESFASRPILRSVLRDSASPNRLLVASVDGVARQEGSHADIPPQGVTMNRSKTGAALVSVPAALVLGVMGVTAVPSPAAGAVETCFGLAPTIVGTDGDDTIVGTDGGDVIVGLGGADTISGSDGDDTICAGPGIDLVYGEAHFIADLPGKDLLDGGPDNDSLYGDIGVGTGGAGSPEPGDDDIIYGRDGDDRVFGETGQDHVFGGAENDRVEGNYGNDDVRGGTGDDTVLGGFDGF